MISWLFFFFFNFGLVWDFQLVSNALIHARASRICEDPKKRYTSGRRSNFAEVLRVPPNRGQSYTFEDSRGQSFAGRHVEQDGNLAELGDAQLS